LPKNFALGHHLPYLVNRAGVKFHSRFGRDLAPHGLTLTEWRVLAALWEKSDLNLSQLAAITSTEISTLSRLTAKLERKQLINRRRSNTDCRQLRLSLTKRGRQLTARLIPASQQYERLATQSLSESDVRHLKRLLVKLYANLNTNNTDRADDIDRPVTSRPAAK